jgi:hypothetical protein
MICLQIEKILNLFFIGATVRKDSEGKGLIGFNSKCMLILIQEKLLQHRSKGMISYSYVGSIGLTRSVENTFYCGPFWDFLLDF